jgi:GntR family transcriptional repressor for pyruvate dehydrogenase complex
MMYALDNMTYEEIREFRYAIERQALVLAIGNVTEENRKELTEHLEGMENGGTEEEQTFHDRMIHATIVKMSDNRLVIANYMALTRVIDRFISEIRSTIRHRSEEEFRQFQSVHRRLVEAICSKDLDAGRKALDDHFVFLQQNIDT